MSAHSSRIALMSALICAGLLSAAFYLEFVSGLVPMRTVPRSASRVCSDMYCVSAVSTAVLWITPDLRSALFR